MDLERPGRPGAVGLTPYGSVPVRRLPTSYRHNLVEKSCVDPCSSARERVAHERVAACRPFSCVYMYCVHWTGPGSCLLSSLLLPLATVGHGRLSSVECCSERLQKLQGGHVRSLGPKALWRPVRHLQKHLFLLRFVPPKCLWRRHTGQTGTGCCVGGMRVM